MGWLHNQQSWGAAACVDPTPYEGVFDGPLIAKGGRSGGLLDKGGRRNQDQLASFEAQVVAETGGR